MTPSEKITRSQTPPPLSPVLIAGFAVRPLPLALLQPIIGQALKAVLRQHPGLFDRLDQLDSPVYLIDPTDLPFVFLLKPQGEAPTIRAYNNEIGLDATATIRGSLLTLLELLQGEIDGDALFFNRDLIVEGDTEHVVALRNAVDGGEVALTEDILALFGPLSGLARHLMNRADTIFGRARKDLETLRGAFLGPLVKRNEAQAKRIQELEEKVKDLSRGARRSQRRSVKSETPEEK